MNATGVRTRRPGPGARRAAVVPLVALLTPVLLVLLGFAVDVAYMQNTRAELRLATDAAARAGAVELSRTDSLAASRSAAIRVAEANLVAGAPLKIDASHIVFGNSRKDASGSTLFTPGATPFNAVQVNAGRTSGSPSGPVSLYFGRLVGQADFEPTTTAVASFRVFDVCLVLDRSSSMKLDVDDPAPAMSTADPRFCQPPSATSRWAALEDAVGVFVSVLDSTGADERVSLVTYSSDVSADPAVLSCGAAHRTLEDATVDLGLSSDLNDLSDEVSAWSNSLYNGMTYIEEGIRTGVDVLTGPGARQVAEKVLIVLTDGHQNVGDARLAVRDCASLGITCHTLTFSNDADRALMTEVATIGGGRHLHANTSAELAEIFREVAGVLATLTE